MRRNKREKDRKKGLADRLEDIRPKNLRMPRSKGGKIALWSGVALGGLWLLGKMGGA